MPYLLALFLLLLPAVAHSETGACIYQNSAGQIKTASEFKRVPRKYRKQARCQGNTRLAAPDQVELEGTVRKETISTSVGSIQLRWPRKLEKLFGRTPLRAMADAARTVSRTLKKPGFPTRLRRIDLDWKVVFLDEDMPETQVPAYLISNCHPGWMTPPANIYIVGQRVAAGCGGGKVKKSVADSTLAEVLLHEMGHAIEYALLTRRIPRDRMRSEGFASWFEHYSADQSSVIPSGSVRKDHLSRARRAIKQNPDSFHFRGSGLDYARASFILDTIVELKGVSGLMRVYEALNSDSSTLFSAIEAAYGWDKDELFSRVAKNVN